MARLVMVSGVLGHCCDQECDPGLPLDAGTQLTSDPLLVTNLTAQTSEFLGVKERKVKVRLKRSPVPNSCTREMS